MKFPDVGGGSNGGPDKGLFLKLKDGDKIRALFRGDPLIYRQHWIGGRSQLCTQKGDCELCKGGDKSKFRFRINVLVQQDGVWVAKVFEQGYGMFKDLKELHEGDYNLEETCLALSRSGSGTDTEYRLVPAKDNGGLKAADIKRLHAIPLIELGERAAETAGEAADANEDVPF